MSEFANYIDKGGFIFIFTSYDVHIRTNNNFI